MQEIKFWFFEASGLSHESDTFQRDTCHFIITMARGSKISPDVHYIVVRLSSIMKPEDIAIYTGISRQSVLHILWYFTHHGTIEPEKERKKKGVHLRDMDLEVKFCLSPYN